MIIYGLFSNKREIIGINERNISFIFPKNPRKLLNLVDDKLVTKDLLKDFDIPFPEVYSVFKEVHELKNLDKSLTTDKFVIKPSVGAGGRGIVVIKGRVEDNWVMANGKLITLKEIQKHCLEILEGVYSIDGSPSTVFLESLIISHSSLEKVSFEGVPDVRIIVYKGIPVMAMVRLPTKESSGKANLHKGALGAGIKISEGKTVHAICKDRSVYSHPDTGSSLVGVEIPFWDDILTMATKSFCAVGLGYLGVDIAIDNKVGPLVLELNARPGLSIQNANQCGLKKRLQAIDKIDIENMSISEKVKIALELDMNDWTNE